MILDVNHEFATGYGEMVAEFGATAVAEQNSAAAQEVSAATEEMSAQAEEVVASVQSLTEMANTLDALVRQFKLADDGRAERSDKVVNRRRSSDWKAA